MVVSPLGVSVFRDEKKMKNDLKATIAATRKINSDFCEIRLAGRGFNFAAGQFFMITVPEHSLRRAFAPLAVDDSGLTFIAAIVGEGTKKLSELPVGTAVKVLAPLGNGYRLDNFSPATTTAILVGGGCGAPSLVLLANTLRARGWRAVHAVFGARSCQGLLATTEMRAAATTLTLATDDGLGGDFRGNVVAALEKIIYPQIIGGGDKPNEKNVAEKNIAVFACGSTPMLKALTMWTCAQNIPCQISLEERMGCGFGACMGCAVKIAAANENGFVYQRVCHDGAVFDAHKVLF